ncbi:MAG: helix-turn-helix domain-containing protein [Candidatus Hodarchaeota archaeon]
MTPEENKTNPTNSPEKESGTLQCPLPFETTPELLKVMQSRFKLTESQSKVYSALLIMGQLTQDETSLYSGVPFAKLSSTLEALEKKHLIKPLPGVVARYRAFAPYQELANEVQAFAAETETSWKQLQQLQQKMLIDFQAQLDSLLKETKTTLDSLNERQGISLNEVAMTTKIELGNVAKNLQSSLTKLSDTSIDEFSSQTTGLQESLIQIIEEGITQLKESQKSALEDAEKAIQTHYEEAENWITSTASRFLEQSSELTKHTTANLEDAKSIHQRSTNSGITAITSEITSQRESITDFVEETTTSLNNSIQLFNQQVQQALATFQKELERTLTKDLNAIDGSLRDALKKRSQMLDQITTELEKTFNRETRKLTQNTEKIATVTETEIKAIQEASIQSAENLHKSLISAVNTNNTATQSMLKETEATISQWPPKALQFSQFAKIQSVLSTLIEQVAAEHDRLLKTGKSEFNIQLKNTYLAQLLEMRTILQKLTETLRTQQSTLSTSFQDIADQVGKRLKRRLATIRKITESFITEFQAKISLQEEQNRTLTKRTQKLLNQEASGIFQTLLSIEGQIDQFVKDRLRKMRKEITQAASDNLAKSTAAQIVVDKQLQSFKTELKKITSSATSALQQEISQLEATFNEYSAGIRNTAETLREEQLHRIKKAMTNYPSALEVLTESREKAASKALRRLSTQVSKRDRQLINDLNTVLSELIPEYSLASFLTYQKKKQTQLEAVELQTISAAFSKINEQFPAAVQKTVSTEITNTIEANVQDITTQVQKTLTAQQSKHSKQLDALFLGIREKLASVQRQTNDRLTSLVDQTLQEKISSILQDCKRKVGRQIRRRKQIDKLIRTTLEQIKTTTNQILGPSNKTLSSKLKQEIANIFQSFEAQLTPQTDRAKQVSSIFKSTLTSLEQVPNEILLEVYEQQLNDQVATVYSPVQEVKSAFEQLLQTFVTNIQAELQSLNAQRKGINTAETLTKTISTALQNTTEKMIEDTRRTLEETRTEVESQISPVFLTTLESTLAKQLLPKLKEFYTNQVPKIKPILKGTGTELSEEWEKFDADSKALTEKHWLPLTYFIDEYSTTTAVNLNALSTAITTSVDQTMVNTATAMTMFEDDVGNLLTATAQAFDREKTGVKEQITQGFNKMQEDWVSQLQETQGMLETLSQEVAVQKTSLNQKMDTMAEDIKTVTSNLGGIREPADAFVANIETELEEQEGRIENLSKSIQDLIFEQSSKIIEGIGEIETGLENFQQNQLQSAQNIIEEIGQACTTNIDQQHMAIKKHLETFASTLSDETEQYINNLQQEIVQLQTVAAKLVDKIKTNRTALETELQDRIQTYHEDLISVLDEQHTSIDKDVSSALESLIEQISTSQTNVVTQLSKWKDEGKEKLDLSSAQIKTDLDDTLSKAISKSAQITQTQQSTVTGETEQLTLKVLDCLSSIDEKAKTTSDVLIQTLTTNFSTLSTEVDKLFSDTSATIEEDVEKFNNSISQETEQTFQSYTQQLDLTKNRLTRATDDSIRHTTENLQAFKDTATTELQQRSTAVEAALKQNISSVEEGLVTQAQQTGNRVSGALSKERTTLKTEHQKLSKDMTSNFSSTVTNSIKTLQLFTQKTEPLLDELRKHASDTEQILTSLWDTLTGVQPAEAERTWRIVSCQGIQNHLLDMFRRVNATVTLVYPSFDEVPIDELSKVRPQNRVHIITTLDGEKQRTAAQKLLQQGNIRIWDNPNMEFYGGSRDGEEVLIAPTYGNQGEIVAIVSDQASYIALFNQTLGPRWISASKEIRLSS